MVTYDRILDNDGSEVAHTQNKIDSLLYEQSRKKVFTTPFSHFTDNFGSVCYATDFAILLGARVSYDVESAKGSTKKIPCEWSLRDRLFSYVDTNGTVQNSCNRNFRRFGIRPVIINFKEPDGLVFRDREFQYGEYPQFAVSNELSKTLTERFNNNTLVKTGKHYTVDGANLKSDKQPFKPFEIDEYEYDNEKYVCIKARVDGILSNGMEVFKGDDVWVKVSYITWIIDDVNGEALSQYVLVSGINVVRPVDYKKPFGLKEEDFFLNSFFAKEIETYDIFEKKQKENEKEIITILDEIKKYQEYYFDKQSIETKIEEVINEHNIKLDNLIKKPIIDTELTIDHITPESLQKELLGNLNNILLEVKTFGEKVQPYYQMIDILYNCVVEKIDADYDEICNDISKVMVIFKSITNEEVRESLKEELLNIIDKNIKYCEKCINDIENDITIDNKSLEELKLLFRSDFHPFLNKIKKVLDMQDIVNEILKATKLQIETLHIETKNETINSMLTKINEQKLWIISHCNEEEKAKLAELFKLKISLYDDFDVVIDVLEKLLIQVNKIRLDVAERINKHAIISSFKVHVNIRDFFSKKEEEKVSRTKS